VGGILSFVCYLCNVLSTLQQLFGSILAGFRWWMIPLFILLGGLVLLLLVLSSMSALSPSGYTIF
jgi:hypothetical protein